MLLVAKKRSRIIGVSKVIAVITLHVGRNAAQVAAFDECSHAACHVTELIVVSRRQLEALVIGQGNKLLSLPLVQCDWFLHVDVTPSFEAKRGKSNVAFG